jgi:hypothetical protein
MESDQTKSQISNVRTETMEEKGMETFVKELSEQIDPISEQ